MKKFLISILNYSRFTFVMLIGIIVLGTVGLLNFDVEAMPEINQPIGIVQTFYPNSGPSDVETNITKVLETEINGLSQIKELRSTSTHNLSSIIVTFENNVNSKDVLDKLREVVSSTSSKLPNDANAPRVIELDFNSQSIVSLSLLGDEDEITLSRWAEDIAEKIEAINGVSKTELNGNVEEIVQIVLDPVKLEGYGLSVLEVYNAINNSNLNVPLGNIVDGQEKVSLRLIGKAESISELKRLAIKGSIVEHKPSLVYLSDVADIKIGFLDKETESLVSDRTTGLLSSVTINVYKNKGGNVVNIVKAIDEELEHLNLELPENITIVKTNDNALTIRNDLSNLSVSGLQTMVIIFITLLFFLPSQEALVASITVPLILLMAVVILYLSGYTLNTLTIFSAILSLGLIVDTSIVIVESVHDFMQKGFNKIDAAKETLKTYITPLTAGTLTTLSAFAPMLLLDGIIGEFIKTIPTVLMFTLFSSLFVSFIFTPLLSSILLSSKTTKEVKKSKDVRIKKLKEWYSQFLGKILDNKQLQKTTIIIMSLICIVSLSLPFTKVLKTQLFPITDMPFLYINIESPAGSSLEQTKILADPIVQELEKNESIQNYILNLGTQINDNPMASTGGDSAQSNYGHFIINLKENASKRQQSFEIASELRSEFENLSDLKTTVIELSAGPPSSAAVDLKIVGASLEELERIALDIKKELSSVSGVINISTDFDSDVNEINLVFDQDKLRLYGLDNRQLTLILQAYTTGIEMSNLEIEDQDYIIKLFTNDTKTKQLINLDYVMIPTFSGMIPLSLIADHSNESGVQSIPHINTERSTQITAELNEGVLLADVQPNIDKVLDSYDFPEGYRLETGGEMQDIADSFSDLFNSMFIAILLILIVLVIQFNSFRQTFIILGTIPLAAIGVFPGLALLRLPLSFPAFLGIVMLGGIVVNNAIILIDQINNNLEDGLDLKSSIQEAGTSRLLPIVLTSLTTILGLVPITFTDAFWRGLGFSVISGLTMSTMLTLIIVPIFYLWLHKEKDGEQEPIQKTNPEKPQPRKDNLPSLSELTAPSYFTNK